MLNRSHINPSKWKRQRKDGSQSLEIEKKKGSFRLSSFISYTHTPTIQPSSLSPNPTKEEGEKATTQNTQHQTENDQMQRSYWSHMQMV